MTKGGSPTGPRSCRRGLRRRPSRYRRRSRRPIWPRSGRRSGPSWRFCLPRGAGGARPSGSPWTTSRGSVTGAGGRPSASPRRRPACVPCRYRAIPRDTARQLEARIHEVGLQGSDPVFQAISASTILAEHHRAIRLVGIRRDYTIHRHRDTYAVTMARRGMPLPALQRILGHTNIQQTMKYASFQPDYGDVARYIDPERPARTRDRGPVSGTRPSEWKT
ncbi:tyrosine-type recombinase/integrase [Candidatus Palauibacter sp.]|uniref:tyrosine-type recombinase/integrase n=1 Tax=Candidatus Palauibacter sp. TaxID=3101350 RepID=UPI003CC6977B